MNIFDIIALVIFFLFVLICTIRGFLKILARLGSFFAAMILSKVFGGMLGGMLLGDILGDFAPIVGTVAIFVLLFILFRIVFGFIATGITKVLHTKTLDKILGAVIGIAGGLASVYLFALLSELIIVVVSVFNADAQIIETIQSTEILKYFMS